MLLCLIQALKPNFNNIIVIMILIIKIPVNPVLLKLKLVMVECPAISKACNPLYKPDTQCCWHESSCAQFALYTLQNITFMSPSSFTFSSLIVRGNALYYNAIIIVAIKNKFTE